MLYHMLFASTVIEQELNDSTTHVYSGAGDWLVMCWLGLEALSRPKPALESWAEPEPWWRLMEAHGSGFTFSKPEPGA